MKKKNKNTKTSKFEQSAWAPFATMLSSSADVGKPIVAIRLRRDVTQVRIPLSWTKKLKFWEDYIHSRYETVKKEPYFEIKREGDEEWQRVYEDWNETYVDLEELKLNG